MSDTASVRIAGVVRKIISSPLTHEADKAEISLEGAEHLYKEIRIENTLQDQDGNEVNLKAGDHVDVTVESQSKTHHLHDSPAVAKAQLG
jgi:uncharacterized protein YfaS (alpha-2-macroglobulin family)